MIPEFSIAINLDEILLVKSFEDKILEKLENCYKKNGRQFKVIFFHINLKESKIKKFVKRNEEYLFKWGTDITKNIRNAWFIINKPEDSGGNFRYYYSGSIESGIDEYMMIANHIKNRGDKHEKGRYR